MQGAKIGDIIYVDRGMYKHFGIYSGNGKVIHVTKRDGGCCDGIIRETSIQTFLDGDRYYTVCSFDKNLLENLSDVIDAINAELFSAIIVGPVFYLGKKLFSDNKDEKMHVYSPTETVKRARSWIGREDFQYNLATNNCEHFAFWCKTGVKESRQVKRVKDVIFKGRLYRIFE